MYTATEKFMAKQIIVKTDSGIEGTYTEVITARPDLKTGIDNYLREVGRMDLIV